MITVRIARTSGKRLFNIEWTEKGFWMVANIMPGFFGFYLEIEWR